MLKLYTLHVSPPCRAVELTAKALGIDLHQQEVNLLAGDHLKPEYLKLNPQHTIPVLDDNGTVICESHAIMIYLVRKFGKDDSLYPEALVKQAKVNAALHFETGVLFARLRFLFEPIFFHGVSEISFEKAENIQKAYQLLEDTLKEDYVVGSSLTIADFSCVSSISSLMHVVPMEKAKYPKIYGWLGRMKRLPYYEEANGSGATAVTEAVLNTLKENATKKRIHIIMQQSRVSSRFLQLLNMVIVKLYTRHMSPPCRAVELTAKALGITLDQHVVNLMAGEHLTPEYLKMNPQHIIPVLDDNGTIIPESHAIMIYLVSKYGKDDSLYPKDLVKQARVNAALHFESGVLFARTRFIVEPIAYRGITEISTEKKECVQKAYQLLEDTLVDDYVAGNSLTIADFSCVSSFATLMGIIPVDKSKFPKIYDWLDRLKKLPYYEEANGSGAEELAKFVRSALEKNVAKA
ncbi:uncharacterized protein LOC131679588 [Topomyia yanbarensis]|uniref:uncharacterized protein LOC131679588 n=1 Tax=Topomyia yanbarensis TaxID=2498891 RepID=UPI00273C68E3|nr:uncharacterized protein LOC131679588 [Topomyia yanbarensis]